MGVLDKIKSALSGSHDDSTKHTSTAPTGSSTAPTVASHHNTTAPTHAASSTPATGASPAHATITDTPGSSVAPNATTHATSLPTATSNEIAFDKNKVTVVFVLGGPGAGKGTQCERLVRDYGFKHLSAGDLLRAEQDRKGSTYGEMIKDYIKEGKIVPMEVTVKLLENAMRDTFKTTPTFGSNSKLNAGWEGGKGRFLIDGFPRQMDQALKFDESVCQSSFVLFISTTEEVMLGRLLERGKTSGRADDNRESITKRFRTFIDTSMPVVDYYRKQDKVVEIDSSPPADIVYDHVRAAVDVRLGLVTLPVGIAGLSLDDNDKVSGSANTTTSVPATANATSTPGTTYRGVDSTAPSAGESNTTSEEVDPHCETMGDFIPDPKQFNASPHPPLEKTL